MEGYKVIGAGLACIGIGSASLGSGIIFGLFVYGLTKNPNSRDKVLATALLGFALTEALGLFALMIAFIILFS